MPHPLVGAANNFTNISNIRSELKFDLRIDSKAPLGVEVQ
jgi:hypothetical protein